MEVDRPADTLKDSPVKFRALNQGSTIDATEGQPLPLLENPMPADREVLCLTLKGTFRRDCQEGIEPLSPGDPVMLVREPTNPKDRNAIMVLSPTDELIGYVPAPVAATLAPILDSSGGEHEGFVEEIHNRGVEETPLGVSICRWEPEPASPEPA